MSRALTHGHTIRQDMRECSSFLPARGNQHAGRLDVMIILNYGLTLKNLYVRPRLKFLAAAPVHGRHAAHNMKTLNSIILLSDLVKSKKIWRI